MQTLFSKRIKEMEKAKPELEKKLHLSVKINGRNITIEGDSVDEFEGSIVLDAISFGFSAKKALLLLNPENIFRKMHIKKYTRRTLESAKSRLIGLNGKTRKTLEEVGDCDIIIGESDVGVIGSAETIEETITAITNLIRGSKQANIYYFLERMNAAKKKIADDLGIKKQKADKD